MQVGLNTRWKLWELHRRRRGFVLTVAKSKIKAGGKSTEMSRGNRERIERKVFPTSVFFQAILHASFSKMYKDFAPGTSGEIRYVQALVCLIAFVPCLSC